MSTSGSWNFLVDAANIIKTAYEDLGVIPPGGTVSSAQSTMALDRLNKIAKQWQTPSDGFAGLKIHTRQRVTLFLAKGQQTYLIGPATTDARASTQAGTTTISANEAAGQTVLSITSNTDTTTYPGTIITMTNGDFIGIQLDDGTIQWTTISGTPSTTATVSDALTSAAAAGNKVYWFTSRAQRIPYVESAVIRTYGRTDREVGIYTEERQYSLGVSDKYADGQPIRMLVEPLRTNTRITFNSQPTDVTEQVILTGFYPAEDYDATTDDIAFPQEAYAALGWELAFRLSPSVGRWNAQMQANHANAVGLYRNLNPENTVLYFKPGGL